jgi:hypothetical protein
MEKLAEVTGKSESCGWMVDEVAFYLYSLIKLYKPEVVIQTGHLWGKSALIILEALTDGFLGADRFEPIDVGVGHKAFTDFVKHGAPTVPDKVKLISVDPDPLVSKNCERALELLQGWYGGSFEFHKETSASYFGRALDGLKSFCQGKRVLVLVDGDHTKAGCTGDLFSAKDVGAGMIVVDDTTWLPELNLAAKEFAEWNGYSYLNIPWYNGIGVLVAA